MKVAELNETIYTVEREIDCLGSLLKDEQAPHDGWRLR